MAVRFSVLLLSLSIFVSVVAGENKTNEDSGYDTKYDNIDVNDLLKNDRLRKNYVKCLLNEGPCTPDGQELKSNDETNDSNSDAAFRDLFIHPITALKQFLVRLTSRRDSNGLLKVYGEAKKRFGHRDTLSDR